MHLPYNWTCMNDQWRSKQSRCLPLQDSESGQWEKWPVPEFPGKIWTLCSMTKPSQQFCLFGNQGPPIKKRIFTLENVLDKENKRNLP